MTYLNSSSLLPKSSPRLVLFDCRCKVKLPHVLNIWCFIWLSDERTTEEGQTGMSLEISCGGFVWCWNLETSEIISCCNSMEISCTDRVNNDEVLQTIKEERDILHTIKWRKSNWQGHILRRNYRLKHIIEGKIKRMIEVTERRVRRRKQLLDDLKETREYWKLKDEAIDRTLWRTRFGRGCGPVAKQTTWCTERPGRGLQRPKKTTKSLSDNTRRSEIQARHATNVQRYHYTNLLRTVLYQEPRP